jgi:hypothetical protein
MTDKTTQAHAAESNMEKDPSDWVTGDEPMTGAQRSYLKTLCEEAKQAFDETLTKAEASRRIDELQAETGRGTAQAEQSAQHLVALTRSGHQPESARRTRLYVRDPVSEGGRWAEMEGRQASPANAGGPTGPRVESALGDNKKKTAARGGRRELEITGRDRRRPLASVR